MARREDLFALGLADFVKKAIAETRGLPPGDECWSSPMFGFTRWIKGHPKFADLCGFEAAELLESVLLSMQDDIAGPWQVVSDDSDDPRAEFIDTWEKIKTPANMDALEVAWRDAERHRLKPHKIYSDKYRDFVSLAGHLQKARPDKPIALPTLRIAILLDAERKSISRYIKFALQEGLLERFAPHVPHRRASEFVFDIGRFNWESGLEDIRSK